MSEKVTTHILNLIMNHFLPQESLGGQKSKNAFQLFYSMVNKIIILILIKYDDDVSDIVLAGC